LLRISRQTGSSNDRERTTIEFFKRRGLLFVGTLILAWILYTSPPSPVLLVLEMSTDDITIYESSKLKSIEIGDDWNTFLMKVRKIESMPYINKSIVVKQAEGVKFRMGNLIPLDELGGYADLEEFSVCWQPRDPPAYVQAYSFNFEAGRLSSIYVARRYLERP
jgi:hypothetical protein